MLRRKAGLVGGALLMILAGCTAAVLNDAPPARLAPAGSRVGRSSTVVYNPDGAKELVTMRREDALKKIVDFCGSNKYRIDREETKEARESGGAYSGLATAGASRLRHVTFTCL